jgi:hypothetical protein
VSVLSWEEEKARCKATWHHFDETLQLAAFGSIEELRRRVSNPESWIANRQSTVLVFSDQVPFWCKIGAGNQVYCAGEVQSRKARKRSHDMLEQVAIEDEDVYGKGESGLRRGLAHAEQTKFRVTYEATQAVIGYLDESAVPLGVVVRGLLVVSGMHARLDNIDEKGKWIEDEEFEYKNKKVKRVAGQSCGNILKTWRKLRKECPDMFEHISLMSQPSAFVDSIIFHWRQCELSKIFCQSVVQRDLFAGALSPSAKASCAAAQSLSTWIQPHMTAVLQLTDTDFSFSFKSAARKMMSEMRREMKLKAASEGKAATSKCGAYEISKTTFSAHVSQI